MKRRQSSIVTYIFMIFLIGMISTFVSSDFPFGAIFQDLKGQNLEVILDTVNLWLGFVALGVLIFLVVFLITREQIPPSFREIWDKKNNDEDEGFPPHCSLLFEKHADKYLDAECLAILGMLLSTYLRKPVDKELKKKID